MKIALITGATAGFGKAIAEKFAANGFAVIITGRRKDRLEMLQREINATGADAYILPFDVQVKEEVFSAINSLPEKWKKISVLVNNAGLALGKDLFDEADLDDWNTMLDTNVKGLLYVTRAVLPYMIETRQGHIINIGSVAGKEVYERGNVYCASKHAVDALSQSMRIDLLRHGIKVTAIHPGAANTEFSTVRFKGDEAAAEKVYEGFQPLSAEDVAEVTYFTASLPAHYCINDLVLTPTVQANAIYLRK